MTKNPFQYPTRFRKDSLPKAEQHLHRTARSTVGVKRVAAPFDGRIKAGEKCER
jgi:hypothetical protein